MTFERVVALAALMLVSFAIGWVLGGSGRVARLNDPTLSVRVTVTSAPPTPPVAASTTPPATTTTP